MDPKVPDLIDKMLLYSLPTFKKTTSENSPMPNVPRSCTTAKLALMVPLTTQCHCVEHFASGLSTVSSQATSHIHTGYTDLGLLCGTEPGKGEGGYETHACCTAVIRLAEGAVCSWTLCPADPLFQNVRAAVFQLLGQRLVWFSMAGLMAWFSSSKHPSGHKFFLPIRSSPLLSRHQKCHS